MIKESEKKLLSKDLVNFIKNLIGFDNPNLDINFAIETNDFKKYKLSHLIIKTFKSDIYNKLFSILSKISDNKKSLSYDNGVILNFGFIDNKKWVCVENNGRYNIVLSEKENL